MDKRTKILLPYHSVNGSVIGIRMKELEEAIEILKPDMVDVTYYPNPDRMFETIPKVSKGTAKGIKDINNDYEYFYNTVFVCSQECKENNNVPDEFCMVVDIPQLAKKEE